MTQKSTSTDATLPDGKNVCPGCGGYVEYDEYKCERCTDNSLWAEE